MIEYFNSTHRWDSNSTNTPDQSGPGSNSNEEVLLDVDLKTSLISVDAMVEVGPWFNENH